MSAVKTHTATLIYDAKATLGEGPVWEQTKEFLFWVDIEGCRLHAHKPLSNKNESWDFNEMIGAAVPMENGKILLAMESGLSTFDFTSQNTTSLGVLTNTDTEMRMNDGKVGPNGNFWIGSMHKGFKPRAGNLYRVSKNLETKIQVPETTISNGMAWSLDHTRFYYIDSPEHRVFVFDYDIKTGHIEHRRVLFTIPESMGTPDGMCIDNEGMLWIAHWGGSCVRRWNPDTGKVIEKIAVDAPLVTSCCFGGKNLNTLYITTASSGMTKKELEDSPLSGGLFSHETKVSGPATIFF